MEPQPDTKVTFHNSPILFGMPVVSVKSSRLTIPKLLKLADVSRKITPNPHRMSICSVGIRTIN